MSDVEVFDERYFAQGCGPIPYGRSPQWLALFAAMAERIESDLAPVSVLDAGCAMGLLVEALRARGVQAWGVDVSGYALSKVEPNIQPFCRQASITSPLPADMPQHYDLVVSIEVLEHLHQNDSECALRNLAGYADEFLFSSSPDDTETASHFNVQPAAYWTKQFAQAGMLRDTQFDASIITPWAMLFSTPAGAAARQSRLFARREARLNAENARLREIVRGYENGRVMRLMNALRKGVK